MLAQFDKRRPQLDKLAAMLREDRLEHRVGYLSRDVAHDRLMPQRNREYAALMAAAGIRSIRCSLPGEPEIIWFYTAPVRVAYLSPSYDIYSKPFEKGYCWSEATSLPTSPTLDVDRPAQPVNHRQTEQPGWYLVLEHLGHEHENRQSD